MASLKELSGSYDVSAKNINELLKRKKDELAEAKSKHNLKRVNELYIQMAQLEEMHRDLSTVSAYLKNYYKKEPTNDK